MRCNKMSSFIVMDIVRDAGKFEDAIHFEIGQPDLPPSPKVKKALHDAIDENRFNYTESLGLYELREKICKHYLDTYDVKVTPERVLLTPGTSGAFLVAYALTLKYSQKLGLSDPSYPCYKNFAHFMDIEPVFMDISKDNEYQLSPLHVNGHKLDALQISSPANPTGNLYSEENLKALIECCEEKKIAFISDELYHGLTYEEKAHTALEYSQNTFVINGFSKFYCMPGIRLGWIIIPPHLVREAEVVAQNLFISAPTLSQYGALEAFDYEYLESIRLKFKERRDFLYNELSSIFEIDAKPEGAFYLWANVSKYTNDSFEFAKKMLQETHVATTPGKDFGTNKTEQYLRFAYTRDIEHMKEGVRRIKKWLQK